LKKIALLVSIFLSLFAATCGIQEYVILKPVISYPQTSNYEVSFRLPDDSPNSANDSLKITFQKRDPYISGSNLGVFFEHYYLFYKIYLSYSNNPSPSENEIDYASINKTWSENYTRLKPLTVDTNYLASAANSTFSSLRFYKIPPTDGTLYRSDNVSLPTPYPADRLFYRSDDLFNTAYQNINNNADVAAITGTGVETYAWAAMYVIRKANNSTTLAEYYSTPTFLGIFLLPGINDNW
jgi:hypothetical protein